MTTGASVNPPVGGNRDGPNRPQAEIFQASDKHGYGVEIRERFGFPKD